MRAMQWQHRLQKSCTGEYLSFRKITQLKLSLKWLISPYFSFSYRSQGSPFYLSLNSLRATRIRCSKFCWWNERNNQMNNHLSEHPEARLATCDIFDLCSSPQGPFPHCFHYYKPEEQQAQWRRSQSEARLPGFTFWHQQTEQLMTWAGYLPSMPQLPHL